MHYLLLLILLCPTSIFAQGYQVNLQGQIQQGMASAGSALPQDASTLFYNPGSSAFVNGNHATLSFTPTFSKGTFEDANNGEIANTTSPVGTPFAAYGLFELKEDSKLKLGLAVYTPFGSTVSWEEGWTGRYALTKLKLLSIFTQPTVSYRFSDKFSFGAGFVYSYGSVSFEKDLPITGQDDVVASAKLSGSGHGFGFNTGLLFKPTEHVAFGFSYRSEIKMKVDDGDAQFNVPSSLDTNFPDGKFSSALPLPQVFTMAVGVTPNEKLSIALDMNYVEWTSYDTLAFDYETNTSSLEDTKSARNYNGTIAIRLGGQYKFTENWIARAGIGFSNSPVSNGYVTPETPDNDRFNYTIGVGYKINDTFQLDGSLLYTSVQRTDTNFETNLSGTYKMRVLAPGISLSYNF